jgi:hypothetical protein
MKKALIVLPYVLIAVLLAAVAWVALAVSHADL